MKVTVCHFVSGTYEVMTTLILVMLVLLLLEWTKEFSMESSLHSLIYIFEMSDSVTISVQGNKTSFKYRYM